MKLYNTNISGIKDRNERLSLIIKNIEKKFGKGALMKLTSQHKFSNLNVSSTGSISLDIITGIGGYPLGRIVEKLCMKFKRNMNSCRQFYPK